MADKGGVNGALLGALEKIESFPRETSKAIEDIAFDISTKIVVTQQKLYNSIEKNQSQMVLSLRGIDEKLSLLTSNKAGRTSSADASILGKLGVGVGSLSMGLLTFSIVPKRAKDSFVTFIGDLFTKLESVDTKKVKDGIEAMAITGKSIFNLAKYMALSIPVFVIGAFAIPLIVLTLATLGYVYEKIGMHEKNIKAGGEAVASIGKSLLYLTGGLGLFMLTLSLIPPQVVLYGLLVLGSLAVTYYFIGKAAPEIKRGAWAMALVGISMIALSAGLALMSLVVPDLPTILKIGASIAITGLAFGLVGKFATAIIEGAIGLAIAGISLIALAGGIYVYKKAIGDLKEEEIENIFGSIVILGSAFALVGLASEAIIPGAIGLAIAGISLIVLAGGLFLYKKVVSGLKEQEIKTVFESIVILGGAFAAVGLVSPLVLLGGAAMIVAGAALLSLSAGIYVMSKAYRAGKDLFADSGQRSLFGGKLTNFEVMMNSIIDSFTINPVSIALMYASVPALLFAGTSLITIAMGLRAFSNLKLDIKTLTTQTIPQVLGAVAGSFAFIGKKYPSTGGFLGLGGSSDVERGVAAVQGIGDVLSDIANGLQAWSNLEYIDGQGKKQHIDFAWLSPNGKITVAIKTVVGALGNVFAELGASNGETGWFSKGLIEKGVDSIKGVGSELVNIAKAVQDFASMSYEDPLNPGKRIILDDTILAKATDKMKMVIRSLSSVFGEIGANPDAQSDWWFGKSNVEKGVASIKGIGESVSGIADFIKSVVETKDVTNIQKRITEILTTLPLSIMSAYRIVEKDKEVMAKARYFFSTFPSNLADNISKMASQADPMKSVADSFEKIAKNMGSFRKELNMLDKIKLEKMSDMFFSIKAISKDQSIDKIVKGLKAAIEELKPLVQTQQVQTVQVQSPISQTNPFVAADKSAQVIKQMQDMIDTLSGQLTTMNETLSGELQVRVTNQDVGLNTGRK